MFIWISQTTEFPSLSTCFSQEYRRVVERTYPGCHSTWIKSAAESVSSVSPSVDTEGSDGEWKVFVLAGERLWTRLGDYSTDNGRNNSFHPGIGMSESTRYAKSKDPMSSFVSIFERSILSLFSLFASGCYCIFLFMPPWLSSLPTCLYYPV